MRVVTGIALVAFFVAAVLLVGGLIELWRGETAAAIASFAVMVFALLLALGATLRIAEERVEEAEEQRRNRRE